MEYKQPELNFHTVKSNFTAEAKFLKEEHYYTKHQWFMDEDTEEYVQWERQVKRENPLYLFEVTVSGVSGFKLNDFVMDSYGNRFSIIEEGKMKGVISIAHLGDFNIGGDFTRIGSVFSKNN